MDFWPQGTDYNEAIQSPDLCFEDPDLRRGTPALNPLGLPMPRSGNFADVYEVRAHDGGQSWAVKCFTRRVDGLQQRYQAISTHLQQANLPFAVQFQYLDRGIRIRGAWYPVLKMRWVEGFTLNTFIQDHLDKPQLLQKLAQMWVSLARQLREARIAHADLQHGNVLLVPRGDDKLGLRLIDYDGMWVPTLAQSPSGELGHASFQHPQRQRDSIYSLEVDRFSHLAIYTALRCLAIGGAALWTRYDNGDNLLFRQADFEEPGSSALLRELWKHPDPTVRALAGHVALAAQAPLNDVPLLKDLVDDGQVAPLSAAQQKQVDGLLGGGGTARPVPRFEPSAPTVKPAPGTSGRWWEPPQFAPASAGPRAKAPPVPALEPEITNSIGMKLKLIPKGKFRMGSPATEQGRDLYGKGNEEEHDVEITKPFYMGVYEVTQAQYREVMGKNPSYFSAERGGKEKVAGLDTGEFPVEQVSWEDAVEFCKRLSALTKEQKAERVYHLPTEAEWEYTCRGGPVSSPAPFHFLKPSSSLSFGQANFGAENPYGGGTKGKGLSRTCRVGSYEPNRLGLYDMHGNAWEWCQDWYDKDYYRNSPIEDPQGPKSSSENCRVLRGGSWDDNGIGCRSAQRLRIDPGYRDLIFGFRVVVRLGVRTP